MIRKLVKRDMRNALYHYNEFGEKVFGMTCKMRGCCRWLWGDCTWLSGYCTGLEGDCTGLSGDCTGVNGDCTGLSGDLDLCEITNDERKHGVKVEDLIFKSEEEK